MVIQQVVHLSPASEHHEPMNGQVYTSTPTPLPPQPTPPMGGVHGVGALGACKVQAVKGLQLDRCGYPLGGLPREPPGVRVLLQLHPRRLGQHSPVHSSAAVVDPWRPDSHLPTPAPPCFPNQEGWRAVSPLGSRLVRGDQGAIGSLGAPLPRVLLGQGSAQHAPGPSFYWDATSRCGTLCNATCDPLGQSRST